MYLSIYRGTAPAVKTAEILISEDILFTHGLMGEHKITAPKVEVINPLAIQLGDYITYKGIKYSINTVPEVVVNHMYVYSITFEGPEYKLYDKLFQDSLGLTDFTLYGTAAMHLQLLLNNINQIDPGWTAGTVDVTDSMFITYPNFSCRVALTTIAQKFTLEYSIANKQISIVKQAGNTTTLSFQYGMNKGLYSLSRKYVSEKNVTTKVFGYGSTRNLPKGYRGGATRLMFEEKFLTNNVELYGVKEGQYTNDEIYPKRDAAVTAIGPVSAGQTTYTLTDSTLDFNINDQLLPGLEAKISFKTGALTGEEFVITNYNHATKTITYKEKTTEAKIVLPNATFKAAVGDIYTLLDIGLPNSYIVAEESKLKAATTTFLSENSIPQVEYDLNLDLLYVRDNGISLNPGDKVTAINASLGVNNLIRVTEVSYPISFPEILSPNTQYKATIANFISYTIQERIIASVINNNNGINLVNRTSVELARRNTANFRDLQNLIFDPDNYFDPVNIKPGSIETGMLSVVVKSQNFRLNGVLFQPNVGGDPSKLYISNGLLEHLEIDIPGLGYSWNVSPGFTFTGLDPLKAYYVYAKASTSALTATWAISDTPVSFLGTAGFYNFNMGILFKVKDGYRDYEFTYGASTLTANNLTTGRVQDITKMNYFDLISALFNLGTANNGLDWGVTRPNALTIRGALMQSGSGITSPLPTYRGGYLAGAVYYKGDTVLYNGTQWIYVNDVAASNQTPADNQYWDIYASIGNAGSNGSNGLDGYFTQFRYQKNGSTTTPPALTVTDTNPAGWTTSQPALLAGEYLWMTSAIKNPPALTRNYFSKNTVLSGTNMTALSHTNPTNPPINGFFAFNTTATPGSVRLMDTVKGNGKWTISGSVYANGNITVRVSFAGGATQNLNINTTDTYFSLTFDVPDSALGYVEISNIAQRSMRFNNLKIQKGSVADAWSPAPEDPEFQDLAALVGTWGAPTRTTGVTGPQGLQGAYLSNTGDFKPARQYVGTPVRLEVTRYNGTYYVTRTDAGNIPVGTLPTNATYFNQFGAQFDSVATGLLLAQLAYIENLGVRYLRTSDAGKRVVIDGDANSMVFYDGDGNEALRLDDDIDAGQTGNPLGGLRMMTPAGDTSYCSGNGYFANGSGMRFISITTGRDTNASVVGILRYKNTQSTGISAGVVGVDQSPQGGSGSKAYAVAAIGNLLVTGGIYPDIDGVDSGVGSVELDVRVGGTAFWKMTWKNGILIRAVQNPG